MAPFLILVAVAAACMGMLNSLNVFFIPALSPAMFNVASIAVGVRYSETSSTVERVASSIAIQRIPTLFVNRQSSIAKMKSWNIAW